MERISDFITNHHLKNHKEDKIPCLTGFGKVAFELVSSIFKGGWDNLLAGDGQKTFRDKIKEESNRFPPVKLVEFTNVPPPQIPTKAFNEKSGNGKSANKPIAPTRSYVQVSSSNVRDILKLKENFPKLSNKKIEEIHKTVNNLNIFKLHINMTTKGLLCKQIIVPIGSDNSKKFLSLSSKHVINLNHALKGIKSEVFVDFIRSNYRGLIIVSNKVMSPFNISVINNYVKNTNNLDINDVQDAQLPQSKSYLKILGIPYLIENTNTPIDSNVLEEIIKATYIFNDIKIISKPHVCKFSPKSNMAIMWIDIWDLQNGSSAKKVIN